MGYSNNSKAKRIGEMFNEKENNGSSNGDGFTSWW